jgi:hypothetical protein
MSMHTQSVATGEKPFANAKLLRLAKYYEALGGGTAMPSKKFFHPDELSWLFGHFYTVDVLPNDYRFGFIGPFWAAMYSFDPMGTRLSEMEACGRLRALRTMYDDAVTMKQSNYCIGRMIWPNGKSILHERITVPFAGAKGEPAMLLVAAQCDRNVTDALLYKGFGEPRLELSDFVHLT